MDKLLQLDYYLFDLINQKMTNSIFDTIFPLMRDEYIWAPLYIFIIAFVLYNFNNKSSYLMVLAMLLTVGTSDIVSSHLIKKNVKRLRPCRDVKIENITQRVRCGRAYSFTSSHACNHFAIASFLSLTFGSVFKRIRPLLFLWAGLICISQVYVGVHFPFDVLCGGILGILIGYLWSKLFLKWFYMDLHPPIPIN